MRTEHILPPIIFLAPAHTLAFAELLELALRLELLKDRPGMDRLHSVLNNDPRPPQLMHLRMQLEVGGLAARAGQEVAFEVASTRESGPADVVVTSGQDKVVIETKAILLDDPTREHHNATDRLFEALRALELRYEVECAGRFQQKLDGFVLQDFLLRAETCARTAHESNAPQTLDEEGSSVTFSPRLKGSVPLLRGPIHEKLLWHRTRQILRKKAFQTHHQPKIWLRVDVMDGLWQFTPWARMELPNKVESLVEPVQEALNPFPHVHGLVMTSGPAHAQGEFISESFEGEKCSALRCLIEPLRVRETIIIPVREDAVTEAKMWQEFSQKEPLWLDWALQRVGLGTVEDIFS